ncbi:MAG: type I polyketide synthase, partial [Chloroflexi bacterium]|nr:type I polyketide synthase [Chloroflexota bacterium]
KSGSIALGSVKSNIGHLKSASGAAGLLKVILGLNHQVLPPTANFSKPNPAIDFSRSAFAPALRADEWRVENGKNRFAGVSSFGFGGTNFHVILEAYAPELSGTLKGAVAVPLQISDLPLVNIPEAAESVAYESNEEVKAYVLQAVSEKTGYPVEMLDLELDLEADLGIDTVKQAELFAQVREHFGIARQDDLQLADYNTLEKVIAFATGFGTNNSGSSTIKAPGTNQNVDLEVLPATDNGFTRHKPNKAPLNGLYFASAQNLTALLDKLSTDLENIHRGNVPQSRLPEISAIEQPERLAIDYADPAELAKRLQKAIDILSKPEPNLTALQAHGIYKGHGTPGKVTFMFPGQGSQYVNMLKDLREHEAIIDQTFIEADQALLSTLGKPLTEYIYANGDPEQVAQAEAELKKTSITQPAILTVNVALLRLLQQYGFEPDFVVGHSLGEYAALVASGVMDFGSALKVVAARGREMSSLQLEDKGCMAAVQAPLAEVETIIKACSDYVVIANANSPMQSVLGGTTAGVDEAIQRFTDAGYQAVKIPVSHAFHTKIIAPASVPLRKTIESMTINAPQIPIIANVDAEIYPHGREEIIDLLSRQVASPVQFVRSMQKLYELGSRVFVEVGPKRVLNALANDNLKDKEGIITLATNHPRKNSVVSFNEAICARRFCLLINVATA